MTNNNIKQTEAPAAPVKSKKAREIVGTVVSSKMDKTIVVQVMRMVKHELYGKYLRKYSKMYVHDVDNQCKEGDVVKIKQSRPISKLKRFVLVEVVRRAERALEAPGSELTENNAA